MQRLHLILKAALTGLIILAKTLLLLPLPAAMVFYSFTVDAGQLFTKRQPLFAADIVNALLAGNAVDNYDRMDERTILKVLADTVEEPFGTLAFGSSRVLQLRAETAGTDSFFNCGMSAADLVDIMGTFYLFERAGLTPKNLVLGLDPWLLSRASFDRNPGHDIDLYNEFLELRLNIPTDYEPVEEDETLKYRMLLSPTYFQENLAFEEEDLSTYVPPAVVQENVYTQTNNIKLADGSVLYGEEYREASTATVDQRALDGTADFLWMDNYPDVDAELCALFGQFVAYVRSQGVEVTFLLVPYHPTMYSFASENRDRFPGFFAVQEWYASYALEHDVPLYGNYNPFITGNLNADYYDGLHIRDDAIGTFFPGVGDIAAERAAGVPPASPWYTGRVPVLPEIAHTVTAGYYEVAPPEDLRFLESEQINGENHYILGRFSNASEEATLLARYAVNMNNGVVLRYDTDWDTWVRDARDPNSQVAQETAALAPAAPAPSA